MCIAPRLETGDGGCDHLVDNRDHDTIRVCHHGALFRNRSALEAIVVVKTWFTCQISNVLEYSNDFALRAAA